jgi:hypothetical protein
LHNHELAAWAMHQERSACRFADAVPQTEKHLEEEKAKIEAEGQTVHPSLFYTKQGARLACCVPRRHSFELHLLPGLCFGALVAVAVIGNACGTIGILHSVANNCSLTGGPVELGMSPCGLVPTVHRFVAFTLCPCCSGGELFR